MLAQDLTAKLVAQFVNLAQEGQVDCVKFWKHHIVGGFQAQYTITLSYRG
jgi:hypothetical protein